ncbi:ABC transporter substrate-binding protein [Frigidibacter sp. MR17.24]|uniref:ABC transporter substrate-binding protein n=1 Tax=Frigidibacter sp. MR17.24 TaxID=3127345 RepID=UPI0030129CF4
MAAKTAALAGAMAVALALSGAPPARADLPGADLPGAKRSAAELSVPVTYLRHERTPPSTLSELDPVPPDQGLDGARLALADSATTGGFLGQHYTLDLVSVPEDAALAGPARQALSRSRLILADMGPEDLLALADLPEAQGALIVNVAAGEARLRSADCRANLLHTALEDGARADALMQVLQAKRWTRLALVTGPRIADRAFAGELVRAATKFGLKIVDEKDWPFQSDLRRSTTTEIPAFTQGLRDHDVVLVADEAADFARYIPDNTFLPRPVAGAAGIVPAAWSPVLEQWGASQLQARFRDATGRAMRPRDFAGWLALRALAEAVTRTGSADPAALRAYLLSPGFALDGFLGRSLSFRPWNGQLRQPVAVANDRALIDLAPVEGFLHQVNEMDTLGLDRPESACRAFGG